MNAGLSSPQKTTLNKSIDSENQGSINFYNTEQRRRGHPDNLVSDVRNNNQTRKFLKTNMKDYLTGTQIHENCISCAKCIALKRKPLAFKYGKNIGSTYESMKSNEISFSPARSKVFNIGSLRQEFKVPYSPPSQMVSVYGNNFYNRDGKSELGSPDEKGNPSQPRRPAPTGDLDYARGVHLKFSGVSTNESAYIGNVGRLPTPNKRNYNNLTVGFGRFYGETSYGSNFMNKSNEKVKEMFREERRRV